MVRGLLLGLGLVKLLLYVEKIDSGAEDVLVKVGDVKYVLLVGGLRCHSLGNLPEAGL